MLRFARECTGTQGIARGRAVEADHPLDRQTKSCGTSQIGWFQATARTPGVTCKTLQTATPASRKRHARRSSGVKRAASSIQLKTSERGATTSVGRRGSRASSGALWTPSFRGVPFGRRSAPKRGPYSMPIHSDECGDCGRALKILGEDITKELDYLPGRFVVNRIVRPRMACKSCAALCQAPLPSRPSEHGRPGSGLLAHVLVSNMLITCP